MRTAAQLFEQAYCLIKKATSKLIEVAFLLEIER